MNPMVTTNPGPRYRSSSRENRSRSKPWPTAIRAGSAGWRSLLLSIRLFAMHSPRNRNRGGRLAVDVQSLRHTTSSQVATRPGAMGAPQPLHATCAATQHTSLSPFGRVVPWGEQHPAGNARAIRAHAAARRAASGGVLPTAALRGCAEATLRGTLDPCAAADATRQTDEALADSDHSSYHMYMCSCVQVMEGP